MFLCQNAMCMMTLCKDISVRIQAQDLTQCEFEMKMWSGDKSKSVISGLITVDMCMKTDEAQIMS